MKFKVGDKVKACGKNFTQEQAVNHWKEYFEKAYGALDNETFVVVSTSNYCSMISNKLGNSGFTLNGNSLILIEENQESIVKETVTRVIPKGDYNDCSFLEIFEDVKEGDKLVDIKFDFGKFKKEDLTKLINTLTQIRDFLAD